MIDKFYYVIVLLFAAIITMFCLKNANHRVRSKTLPAMDTTYVDAFHVDSTGKYLINWKGDTCR